LAVGELKKRSFNNSQTRELINKLQDYLSKMPIEKAWIFGSLSRGEWHAKSDIDILVKYLQPKTIDLFDYVSYIVDLEKITKRKIDLVEEGFELDFAKKNIENDKILIYERKD